MAAGALHAGLAGRLARSECSERQRGRRCRNCTLVDKSRKWAYRAIRQVWPEYEQWLQACYERASAYNLQFSSPLDENEVRGIAKSIAKWTTNQFNSNSFSNFIIKTHTSEIQSKRGVLSGVSRRAGSLEERKPWDELGISRRKFFYLKKKA